jgi:hypothetical protein
VRGARTAPPQVRFERDLVAHDQFAVHETFE